MLEALIIIAVLVLLVPRLIQFATRRQFMTKSRYIILFVIAISVIAYAINNTGHS